jgi:hypothetical protein
MSTKKSTQLKAKSIDGELPAHGSTKKKVPFAVRRVPAEIFSNPPPIPRVKVSSLARPATAPGVLLTPKGTVNRTFLNELRETKEYASHLISQTYDTISFKFNWISVT